MGAEPLAPHPEAGLPVTMRITDRDYLNEVLERSPVQHASGLIYYSRGGKLMEFDGVNRRGVDGLGDRLMYALALGEDGTTLYIGSSDGFGRMVPDARGQLQYESLSSRMEAPAAHDFRLIWMIDPFGEGAFFRALNHAYFWPGGEAAPVLVLNSREIHSHGFVLKGEYYLAGGQGGVKRWTGSGWTPLPGTAHLNDTRDAAVVGSFPERDGAVLLVTAKAGLYRFDGESAVHFPTDADSLLGEGATSRAFYARNELLAVGTLLQGLILLKPDGRIYEVINSARGLDDAMGAPVLQDSEEGLWVAGNNGIQRLDWMAPYTVHDGRTGLVGRSNDVARFEGKLIGSTANGRFLLEESLSKDRRRGWSFQRDSTKEWTNRSLLVVGDRFLSIASRVGTHERTLTVTRGGQTELLLADNTLMDLKPLLMRDDAFVVLFSGRVTIGTFEGDDVTFDSFGIDSTRNILSVVEGLKDDLWMELGMGFVARAIRRNGVYESEVYSSEHGLPANEWITPIFWGGDLILRAWTGMYRFDEEAKRFINDNAIVEQFPITISEIPALYHDNMKDLWISRPYGIVWLESNDEGFYVPHELDFGALEPLLVRSVYREGSVAWLTSSKGLIRFDTRDLAQETRASARTLLIEVKDLTSDQVIRGSHAAGGLARVEVLPPDRNSLRFGFALPAFKDPTRNEWQVWMEGLEEGWSNWTRETFREYRYLPPGSYRFHVRGRTPDGTLAPATSFSFVIEPPWTQTAGARLAMVLLGIALVMMVVRFGRSALAAENKRLARVIEARTAEVRAASEAKSRFIAHISHEIRNPVGGILEMVRTLLRGCVSEDEGRRHLQTIEASTDAVLRLTEDLLDISRIESGNLSFEAIAFSPCELIEEVLATFRHHADGKGIDLRLHVEPTATGAAIGDPTRVRQVISNLVGNGVKFTAEGHVAVALARKQSPEGTNWWCVRISDTGKGIPPDLMDRLFEPFEQGSARTTRKFGGAGLGLSISKGLVERMKGTLTVSSELDAGTTFELKLPLPVAGTAQVERVARDHEGASVHGEGPKQRVLVADDTDVMRELVRLLLTNAGHTVTAASDGQAAFEAFCEHPSELVLLDVHMPRMEGSEVARHIRRWCEAKGVTLPYIALMTASVPRMEMEITALCGAQSILPKPLRRDALNRFISEGAFFYQQARAEGGAAADPAEAVCLTADQFSAFIEQRREFAKIALKNEAREAVLWNLHAWKLSLAGGGRVDEAAAVDESLVAARAGDFSKAAALLGESSISV